mgnify:CR=1 FL=1
MKSVCHWLVAVATADGADFEVKARMPRMPAVLDKIFSGFLRRPDLGKDSVGCVVFSVVGAETALTFMHMEH